MVKANYVELTALLNSYKLNNAFLPITGLPTFQKTLAWDLVAIRTKQFPDQYFRVQVTSLFAEENARTDRTRGSCLGSRPWKRVAGFGSRCRVWDRSSSVTSLSLSGKLGFYARPQPIPSGANQPAHRAHLQRDVSQVHTHNKHTERDRLSHPQTHVQLWHFAPVTHVRNFSAPLIELSLCHAWTSFTHTIVMV